MSDNEVNLAGVAGIASLIGGLAQGRADYKTKAAEEKLKRATMKVNNQRTIATLMSTYRATEAQADSVTQQHKANVIDAKIAASQARGAVLAAAGASGTGGSGVAMQQDDVTTQTARNISRLTINKNNQIEAIQMKQRNARAEAEASLQLMPTQEPNLFAYSLAGLGSGARTGLGVYNEIKDYEREEI